MAEPYKSPPGLSLKIIRLWCDDELYEEIEGNLYEFYSKSSSNSNFKSKFQFWYEVLSYLRPSTFKSVQKIYPTTVFNFNPKLTFRNLWQHRATTAINLGGFVLGLMSVLYLYFYVQSELKYDAFHKNSEKIYRTLRVGNLNGTDYDIGVTSGPFAEGLRTDFPQSVQTTCRAYPQEGLISFKDNIFYEEELLFVDKNFFEFFSFPLEVGDAKTVFSNPNTVVISSEMALKYFGSQDPIGQVLMFDNRFEFIVSGVLGEFPTKSHLDFQMAFSIDVLEGFSWFNDWWSNGLITYLTIDTPEEAAKVEAGLDGFMDKYFGEDFKTSGNKIGLKLQPLSEVYFTNDVRYDRVLHGNINTLYILIAVAIGILFIAAFNYINLSLAQSFKRAKEVGIRKIMGGGILRLTVQFFGEVIIILIVSMGVAVLLTELLIPYLNLYFGLDVVAVWADNQVIYFLLSLFGITLLISGLYPAIQLTGFQPLKILKGAINPSSNSRLRQGLVIGQFVISIFLITATLLISIQLKFMASKELGFNQEAIVLVDLNNSDIRSNLESFKAELLSNSNIQSISYISGEPGGFHDASTFIIEGIEENHRMRTLFTDHKYLETFEIKLVDGRNFTQTENIIVNGGMMLNETAVKELGLTSEELMGRKVTMPLWDIEREIIGVVSDFHFLSLHDKTEPLMIIQGGRPRLAAIRTNAVNIEESMKHINIVYAKISPSYPISYEFLDENLNRLYDNERKQSHVFTVFSGISIFLACLGVLGLTSYAARRRQKEFGIRKVLGASAKSIIGLISKEFIVLIFLATVVAIPMIIYFISDWLSGFAYRIQLMDHWLVFVISGLAAAAVAWLSVGLMTYRAAILKPTECIRNE